MMRGRSWCSLGVGVVLVSSIAACAQNKPARATEPTLTSGALRPASPTLNVSEDLVRACNLHVDNISTAPKFDFDKSELLPADRAVLGKLVECLTTGPLKGHSLRLVGRADLRGEPQYNMALGAQRASGVATYLATAGLARDHVALTSRGELDAVGTDEAGWQTDRRVDIVLAK